MAFRPNNLELGYTDTILVAYTHVAGACFCPYVVNDPATSFIGQDARTFTDDELCYRIAVLDAAFGIHRLPADLSYKLQEPIAEKAFGRANIVCNEVSRLASQRQLLRPKILTIGSVGTIISELVSRGYEVFGTDLDSSVVGKQLSGVTIADGNQETLSLLQSVDIAIVTGMTFATGTFDSILATGIKSNTAIVMFCQTGANFAPYLRELGVNSIVAEYFPFYMFPGESAISIFRS